MFKSKQASFTIVELVAAIAGVSVLALVGFIIYAVFHFIAKFW